MTAKEPRNRTGEALREAWREIEAALRAAPPPEPSWRRAMDRSRRHP